MEWGWRVFMCIMIPAFFFAAFHPMVWAAGSKTPFFIADRHGMYFISNSRYIIRLGGKTPDRTKTWLFVPWENIANIRETTVSDYESKSSGAVFDIKASPEQVS